MNKIEILNLKKKIIDIFFQKLIVNGIDFQTIFMQGTKQRIILESLISSILEAIFS